MRFPQDAPCARKDPWLFDQMQIDMAIPALQICKGCSFWQNCEDLLEPKRSYYDGICGGKVWKNGRILAKLNPSSPNTFTIGITADEDAMAISSGSELFGN